MKAHAIRKSYPRLGVAQKGGIATFPLGASTESGTGGRGGHGETTLLLSRGWDSLN